MQKIIDTHIHLWDLIELKLPWLKSVPLLNKTFTLADYVEATADCGAEVEQAIYIEVDCDPTSLAHENEIVIRQCQQSNSILTGACISGDLSHPKFINYISKYQSNTHVKGVRQVLHTSNRSEKFCLNKTFIHNVQYLGEVGLIFEGCIRNEELGDLFLLAKSCPNTSIVVNHMGIPDAKRMHLDAEYKKQWEKNIKNLASLDNVFCKISGLNISQPNNFHELDDCLDFTFDQFNEDKVLFASNYPVCNLSMSISEWIGYLLKYMSRYSQEVRNNFFYKNAKKLYRLSLDKGA